MVASWTLSIELWSSFFVYLLAQSVIHYEQRWTIYFFLCLAIWIPNITDRFGYTHYKVEENLILVNFPYFVIGTAIADLETLKNRPLDGLRDLNFALKIPINLALLFLFVSFGSYNKRENCEN